MSLNDVEDMDKRAADIASCCFRFDLTGHIFEFRLENAGSTSIMYALKFLTHLYDPCTHGFTATKMSTPQTIHPTQSSNLTLDLMAETASLALARDDNQAPQPLSSNTGVTPTGFSSPKMKMIL